MKKQTKIFLTLALALGISVTSSINLTSNSYAAHMAARLSGTDVPTAARHL